MTVLFLLFYLLAGIFFGLSAGHVRSRVDFLSLGLLMWVLVPLLKLVQNL